MRKIRQKRYVEIISVGVLNAVPDIIARMEYVKVRFINISLKIINSFHEKY